jgi:hypothetical protein
MGICLPRRHHHTVQYDTIILGHPNWWASIPMPITSFLEAYGCSGKTILPLCSHGGGRFGQSHTAIAKLVPDATFEPGARTAWHAHPLGQTPIVTAGLGRVQAWGGPVQEIRPGDVVRFAPNEKHWHGASPTTAMSHIALSERHESEDMEWMEHVSDEQYRAEL